MPGEVSLSGRRVRAIREALGLTQTGLGSLLGAHGVTVCRWEHGVPTLAFESGLLLHFEVASKCRDAKDVRNILASDGPVAALHFLLCLSFAKTRGTKSSLAPQLGRRKVRPHAG